MGQLFPNDFFNANCIISIQHHIIELLFVQVLSLYCTIHKQKRPLGMSLSIVSYCENYFKPFAQSSSLPIR